VLVVVNYLAEQIETYLAGQKHFASWQVVRQDKPRGTGDALRSCREHLRSERFLVMNGDDLYGAADLERLAAWPAGVGVPPADAPKKWGIAFTRSDGSLERLLEKPDITGRRLANTGAYLFPADVFATELKESARGEYEITDYVTAVAARQRVELIEATFWL